MTITAATDPLLRWMGRTQPDGNGGVRLGYPGVSLSLRTTASFITMQVTAGSADCYFDLLIDGKDPTVVRLPAGRSEIVLAEGLDPQQIHHLELVRRTESWMGVATIHDIRTADGALLAAQPAFGGKLLFIGDSITCGACVDCLPPDFPSGHGTANATRSFGMDVGRRLGAQVHLISYGGRGLLRDYQGLGNDQIANAPVFFERALPDEPDALWDHNAYQPDAIVVGLGTNDFSLGIPDATAWSTAYERFAQRLRTVHPDSHILLTTSPMIGSRTDNGDAEKAAFLTACLATVVQRRTQAGDTRISYLCLPHAPGLRNSHPDAHGHRMLADALEPVLRLWCSVGD